MTIRYDVVRTSPSVLSRASRALRRLFRKKNAAKPVSSK